MMPHGQIKMFVDTATKKPSSKFTNWFLVGTSLIAFQYVWWKAPDGTTHVQRYEVTRPVNEPFAYSNLDKKILATTIFITTTGSSSFSVPADWNNGDNSVQTIGAGGSGGVQVAASDAGTGGGGGAWNKGTNISLTPGGSATVQVGAGGAARTSAANGISGGDTWFNGASLAVSSVGSKGGSGGLFGAVPVSGGAGGVGASGVGNGGSNNGGAGGNATNPGRKASGGGGAGGPNGAGVAGTNVTTNNTGTAGGAADNGSGGSGGAGASGGSTCTASPGNNGNEFDVTHGCGGGGGGAGTNTGDNSTTGGSGGLYGGGGGGACNDAGSAPITSGAGGNGLIVVIYTPFIPVPGGNTINQDIPLGYWRTKGMIPY